MKFKAYGGSASKHDQKGNKKHRFDKKSRSSSSTLFAKFVKKKDLQSSQVSGKFIKKSKGTSFKLNRNETSAQQSAFEFQDKMDSTHHLKTQKKLKKLKFFPKGEMQTKVVANLQSNESIAFNLTGTYKNSNKWNRKSLNEAVPVVADKVSSGLQSEPCIQLMHDSASVKQTKCMRKQELKSRSSDTGEAQAFDKPFPSPKLKETKNMSKKKKLKSGLQSISENNMLIGRMQETEVPQQFKKLKKRSKAIRTDRSNLCNDVLGEEEQNTSLSKVKPAALSKALKYEEHTASDNSKKKKRKPSFTEIPDLQLRGTDELQKKKHKKFLQRSAIFDGNDSVSGTKNYTPDLDISTNKDMILKAPRGRDSKVKSEGVKKRKKEQSFSKNSDLINDAKESCSGVDEQDKNFRLDYGGSENSEQKKKRRKKLKNCFDDVMQNSTTAKNVITKRKNSYTSISMLKSASTAADEDATESTKMPLETEPSKVESSDFIRIPKKELRGFVGREDTPERLGRTVFVGNLPLSIDKKLLQVLFRNFGKVESVRLRSVVPAKSSIPKKVALIRKEFHNESQSVNAYVVFKKQEDARKALVMNKTVLQGHHIRVDLFKSNSVSYDNKRSVFIGNLPFNATDESLWAVFGECGSIEAVRVVRDPTTGAGKGFGFVLFEERHSVKSALSLNETEVNGRRIRVKTVEKEKKVKGKTSEGSPRINSVMEKKNVSRPGWRSAGQKKTKKKLIKKKKDIQKKKSIASILTH